MTSSSDKEGPDWLLISIMSACLAGLFIICISVIIFLYLSARSRRPSSPTPSSSTNAKVKLDILWILTYIYGCGWFRNSVTPKLKEKAR